MTNIANLAKQIAAAIQDDPEGFGDFLGFLMSQALPELTPEKLRMLASLCPDQRQQGYVCKKSLHTYANERDTRPAWLGIDQLPQRTSTTTHPRTWEGLGPK